MTFYSTRSLQEVLLNEGVPLRTVSQIIEHATALSRPSHAPFTFGEGTKHEHKTFEETFIADPSYIKWFLEEKLKYQSASHKYEIALTYGNLKAARIKSQKAFEDEDWPDDIREDIRSMFASGPADSMDIE